jgi:hypothetical protein
MISGFNGASEVRREIFVLHLDRGQRLAKLTLSVVGQVTPV